MITRREFGALALSALAAPRLAAGQTVKGVRLGVQTYSFRNLPRAPGGDALGPIIRAMTECGLTECELWAPQAEPSGRSRDALRAWRLETPLDYFRGVKRRFEDAGVRLYAYNYSPDVSFTDEEIDRGFEMAKALGAEIITASTTLGVARRILPFATRHRMAVAFHGHSNVTNPDEFATPESFATAMALSPLFMVNLDIGHFTAAGFDPVRYIQQHHDRITNLHIKDMKRNEPGSYTPWGEGDTPIADVLRLLQKERWPIRAYLEYEYRGGGTPVEEVRKCFEYAKQALG